MELNQRVEQISATIRELRQNAGDGRKTRQLLDSLFRTVHSLKAAASAEGLNDVSRIAHEFENLLHSLRTGKLTLDDELLRVFDDTTVALLGGAEPASVTQRQELSSHTPETQDVLPAELTALKDDERHRAVAAMREGSNLYVMEAVFEVTDFEQRFRSLKEQLDNAAEVISTSVRMQEDKIHFQILYAAKFEKIRAHTVFQQAILAGKATAASLGKRIEFTLRGDELLLDKSLSDALSDSLLHLVRNAVDHGIESHGTILIETADGQISVTDDGRGIDPTNIPLLFQPGFSTATEITEFSGRGVGLDVVKTAIEDLGGRVNVTSESGKGTSFKITLPSPSSDA